MALAATLSVTVIGVGLVILGIVLAVVTVAFWRGSAEDPEVLASLEVMADRRFARADDTTRARMLATLRGQELATTDLHEPESFARPPSGGDGSSGSTADDTASLVPLDPLLGGATDGDAPPTRGES